MTRVESPFRPPTEAHELLIRAAVQPGPRGLAAWNEWQAGRDLAGLDAAAVYALPAVFVNLREFGDAVAQRSELAGLHLAASAWAESAVEGLATVVAAFQAAGVPLMLLKGLPLSMFYYRDLGARLMCDLDLLVRPGDLHAAAEILHEAGWQRDRPLPSVRIQPFICELEFHHPRYPTIDLHWKPLHVDCCPEVEQEFLDRAAERELEGGVVLTPDTTDLLLLTCFGTMKGDSHAACRWVADSTALVRSSELPVDWGVFVERVERAGLVPAVRRALLTLQEFEVEIPEAVLTRVRSASVELEAVQRYDAHLLSARNAELLDQGLWGRIRSSPGLARYYFWRFSAVSRARGRGANPVAFPRHMLATYQFAWGLGSTWEVPFVAIRKVIGEFAAGVLGSRG